VQFQQVELGAGTTCTVTLSNAAPAQRFAGWDRARSCATFMIWTLKLLRTLEHQAASINKTVEYVLERLSFNAPGFVSFFKHHP
jgi:hypothetical protein